MTSLPIHSARQRGRTAGETLFALLVVSLIGVGIYAVLRSKPAPAPQTPKKIYAGMTTGDGLIPIKAVIVPAAGALIYTAPSASTSDGRRLPMFESYFALETSGDFVRIGNDPTAAQGIGWVRNSDVILWTTKEALRPNRQNGERKPMKLWSKREDIGHEDRVLFDEDPENDPRNPYPVLGIANGSYQIALTWQSADFGIKGVSSAWTPALDIPNDATFYYLTTRTELKHRYEEMSSALLDLKNGVNADHPVVRLLKEHLSVAAGDGIDSGDEDGGLIRRALHDLRNPLRITDKQPADIRREGSLMRKRLQRLKRFYQRSANWNGRGIGWLPAEDLPGM